MLDFTRTNLNGKTLIVPRNCGRDGSLVAKRVAGSKGGVAATGCHRIEIDRYVDADYLEDMAGHVVGTYRDLAGELDTTTLVIGTPHRLSLYLGEVLNCMVLPAGILGFSRSWEEASTVAWGMVGVDYARADRLWLWLKPNQVHEVPSSYVRRMRKAERLVLVHSTSLPEGSYHCWRNLIVSGTFERWHDPSVAERLLAPIRSEMHPVAVDEAQVLRQWEWGLPDACIEAYRQAWLACGKPADSFTVVEGETVDLYRRIVPLWERYLAWLGKEPRGMSFNSYWIAHPGLERELALIPIHFYRASMLESTIRVLVSRYGSRLEEFYAFVNNTGGCDDTNWVRRLWEAHGWGSRGKGWFARSFDMIDGVSKDVFGGKVLSPHVLVAGRTAGAVGAAMPFDAVLEAVAPGGCWN